MTRIWRPATGVGALMILLLAAVGCSNGASPVSRVPSRATVATHSGSLRLFESARLNNRATVLLTGVIADSGESIPTDRKGHVRTNGSYEKLILKHGSIRLDNRSLSSETPSSHINSRTCSGSLRAAGKVPVLGGTGAYAEISGSINEVAYAGFDLPRHQSGPKKGKCAGLGSATAHFSAIIAVGSVSF